MRRSHTQNSHNPVSEDFHKEQFPFYWIARLNNIYHHHMESELRKVGADLPTWRILSVLHEDGKRSMSDIALHAVAKLPTITKIVYRLEERGLVRTSTSPLDARVTEVALTPAGEQMLAAMRKATESIFLKSYSGLSPVKIERLNRMLMQVFGNLEHYY